MVKQTQLETATMKNQFEIEQFIKKIDCNFPYNDLARGKDLIDEATGISEEAIFSVVHELVRIPKNTKINKLIIKELINYIELSFAHPLKDTIFVIAKSLIDGQKVPDENAIAAMNKVSAFRGYYSALNIVYFASWSTEIDNLYNEIKNKWETPQ